MKIKYLFLSLAAISLLAAGCSKPVAQQQSDLIKKDSAAISKPEAYSDYSEQAVATAQNKGKKIVLFFILKL